MVRWAIAVVVGAALVTWAAWDAGRQSMPEPQPVPSPTWTPNPTRTTPTPTQTTPSPPQPYVPGPQIIERERITERGSDDDDDQPAPRVTVLVPRQPTSQPRPNPPATTRPPLVPDVQDLIGDVKVPELGGPLLP